MPRPKGFPCRKRLGGPYASSYSEDLAVALHEPLHPGSEASILSDAVDLLMERIDDELIDTDSLSARDGLGLVG